MPFIVQEQAAPSTPATGYVTIYAKTDGLLYGKDDAGTETQLSNVGLGGITLGTPQASTSGTAIDFTNIPSGVKRIIISLVGVSTNSTSDLLVQIGDSGGIENTGYTSTSGDRTDETSSTAGFIITSGFSATIALHGQIILNLENSSAFTWTSISSLARSDVGFFFGAGSKSLSAALDRVRITSVSADTFDAGQINIQYE